MRRLELTANLLLVFGPFAIGMVPLILLTHTLRTPTSQVCCAIGLVLLFRCAVRVIIGTPSEN